MAEFVVIGGGVVGAGVAWELARRTAEVRLVEARDIAGGASGGLGKRGVRANGRDLRELALMRLAYRRWPTLADEIGAPTGYERTGHLQLIELEKDHLGAGAVAWAQERQGVATRVLGATDVHDLEPSLSERVIGALYCPDDGVADHTATTRGLAQAAKTAGAEIQEQTPIVAFERHGDRVAAVLTAGEERLSVGRALLLLANSGTPELLETLCGLTVPVWRILPQVVLTESVSPVPVRHLIGHASRRLAMKATSDGRVMISGGWRGRWNRTMSRGETQDDQVRGNVAEAVAVFPCLEGVPVAAATADRPESMSVDAVPIIDRVPGVTNVLFATGWSGHGWAIAPAVFALLAEWAVTGRAPEALGPFAYRRFFSG